MSSGRRLDPVARHVLFSGPVMSTLPRRLVVVRREADAIFDRLRAEFAPVTGDTEVIRDRRVRDRRVIVQDVESERRRGERRAPLDATVWTTRGYIMARPQAPGPSAGLPGGRLRRSGRRLPPLRGSGSGPDA